MKGIDQTVGSDVPVLGHSGYGLGRFLVQHGEPFKERHEDVHIGIGYDDMRIEVTRFGQISDQESLGPVAFLDRGFVFGAPAKECTNQQGGNQKESSRHAAIKSSNLSAARGSINFVSNT